MTSVQILYRTMIYIKTLYFSNITSWIGIESKRGPWIIHFQRRGSHKWRWGRNRGYLLIQRKWWKTSIWGTQFTRGYTSKQSVSKEQWRTNWTTVRTFKTRVGLVYSHLPTCDQILKETGSTSRPPLTMGKGSTKRECRGKKRWTGR